MLKYGTRTQGHASLRVNVAKALPTAMRGRVYEISHVRTEPEYRAQGHATDLMAMACLDADLAGKFLMIHVQPDSDSPLNLATLAKFYGKFGFAPIQAAPLLMVRPCLGEVAA
jgi:predicted GNAT family acetyltransferase